MKKINHPKSKRFKEAKKLVDIKKSYPIIFASDYDIVNENKADNQMKNAILNINTQKLLLFYFVIIN